jgi:hypothetical protein
VTASRFFCAARDLTRFGGSMQFLTCRLIRRQIVALLVTILAAPVGEAAAAPLQQNPPAQQQQTIPEQQPGNAPPTGQPSQSTAPQTGEPAAGAAQSQSASPSQSSDQNGQSGSSPSSADQKQNGANPVGTAAAPYEKTTGVAASRPAGAVIAPAKQRRVRSILIKLSLVVGAGVAVGTVAALSHGSPSRPQ